MNIIERIRRELARLIRRTSQKPAADEPANHAPQMEQEAQTQSAPEPRPAPEPTPAPEPDTPQERVEWRFGGFDGSRAAVDESVKIGSVRVSDDRISYKWVAAPRDWKRSRTEKGDLVLACAFLWDDSRGAWVGGKFDWTDESRNSRSTENILHGYNGWDAGAWKRAKTRGFCIASPDGKQRSAIVKG